MSAPGGVWHCRVAPTTLMGSSCVPGLRMGLRRDAAGVGDEFLLTSMRTLRTWVPCCDDFIYGVTGANCELQNTGERGERGSWVRLFSCSSRLTVPPLAQFHGAGSFFRSSSIFLLFPRCDSRCVQVVQMFVIQPRQRMRESCCSLGVRITPLCCRCVPLSKET